jgi:hypothetical protein
VVARADSQAERIAMDEKEMTELLNRKLEWMERLYELAKNLDMYQWTPVTGIRHRCGGEICVYVETTGIGYVCQKCQDAEVL